MKIKMNWGMGIIISSAVFMTFTVITGITLMNQKVDLVTDNYYEKELKYQDQIDKETRTNYISDKIDITQLEGNVNIIYKNKAAASIVKGEIKFYRPSDSARDFTIPISLDDSGKQGVDISKIQKGYWKVQVNWSEKNSEYYFEKPIIIN